MDKSMFARNEGIGRGKENIGLVGHMMTVSRRLGFLGVVIDKRRRSSLALVACGAGARASGS